jgi:hypothetical protein
MSRVQDRQAKAVRKRPERPQPGRGHEIEVENGEWATDPVTAPCTATMLGV